MILWLGVPYYKWLYKKHSSSYFRVCICLFENYVAWPASNSLANCRPVPMYLLIYFPNLNKVELEVEVEFVPTFPLPPPPPPRSPNESFSLYSAINVERFSGGLLESFLIHFVFLLFFLFFSYTDEIILLVFSLFSFSDVVRVHFRDFAMSRFVT